MEDLEEKSTQNLIDLALTGGEEALSEEDYEEHRWACIAELHKRGSREVFDAAAELCRSGEPEERAIGADIIGQLGVPERAFPEEALNILYGMIGSEDDPVVLFSVLVGIGHTQAHEDDSRLEKIIELKGHPEADVRFGVVQALSGHTGEAVVETMLEMMSDDDEDVRDWATYAIGSVVEIDSVKVREALWERLEDEDIEVSDEALLGLARRKDDRIYDILLQRFTDGQMDATTLDFEAAAELGDTRLIEPLRRMFESSKDDLDIDENWIEGLAATIEELEKMEKGK